MSLPAAIILCWLAAPPLPQVTDAAAIRNMAPTEATK
jgi:hypothetical protein